MDRQDRIWRKEVESLKGFVRSDREKVAETLAELSELLTKEEVLLNRLTALISRRGNFVRRLLDVLVDRSVALAETEGELLEEGGIAKETRRTETDGTAAVEAGGSRAEWEDLLGENEVLSQWQEQ